MSELADVLREAGRDAMNIADGEYFDSAYFDKQATAVRAYVERLIQDSCGDTDYIKWAMRR